VKVRIEAELLVEALAVVSPAVSRPGTAQAVLQGVRFDASGVRLTVQASNLDLTITHGVRADVGGSGSVVVPHALLTAVAGRLTGAVEVTAEDRAVFVRAGNRAAELRALDSLGWPRFPPMAGEPTVVTAADRAILHRVATFAGTDPSRPALTCVRVLDGLAVATDSYRLAAHPVDCAVDALVPAGLIAAVGDRDQPLSVLAGALAIEVRSGRTVWRAATVEGDHLPLPSVQALTRWGVADPLAATVARSELLDALDLAAVVAARGSEAVRLRVSDGAVELTGAADGAATRVVIDAATAGAIEVGFNWRYLRDLLWACPSDEVTLTFVDPTRPVRVIDGDLIAIVMPVRLAESRLSRR
jgi:DNA polymerase III subunit beta